MAATLLLTPECQSLWVLSPSMLFLYDEIVMDRRDLDTILNPTEDTRFAAMKARIAENLRAWGYLRSIAFEEYLDQNTRSWIHSKAAEIVRRTLPQPGQSFVDSKFYALSVHTHEEYAKYLENVVVAVPAIDEALLRTRLARLDLVYERLRRLQDVDVSDDRLEELAWALERICAKVAAGLIVSSRSQIGALFDTEEYKPFIEDVLVSDPSLIASFASQAPTTSLRTVVAALAAKEVPDVRIADEYQLFASLRDRDEFQRLRTAIRNLEQFFGTILREHTSLAREKIAREISRLEAEYRETVDMLRTGLGDKVKWHALDMLVGGFAGFLQPFVEDAKHVSTAQIERAAADELLSTKSLASDLFFLAELWKRYKVLDEERYRVLLSKRPKGVIWGQDPGDLPWYESA